MVDYTVRHIFQFDNVPVYGRPRFKPGPRIHSPYSKYLPFTKAYKRIMVQFGKASRAGLWANVRMSENSNGDAILTGEIEVPLHGS